MTYQQNSRTPPARGQASVRQPPPQQPPWWRRWRARINQMMLAAGALATAVTAVLTLYNTRDAQETATFTSVTADSGIPFNEYRQRWSPPRPVARSLHAAHLIALTPTSGQADADAGIHAGAAAATAETTKQLTPRPTTTRAPNTDPADGQSNSTNPDGTSSASTEPSTADPSGVVPSAGLTADSGSTGARPSGATSQPAVAPEAGQPEPVRALLRTRLPPLFRQIPGAAAPPLFSFAPEPRPPQPGAPQTPNVQVTTHPATLGACTDQNTGRAVCGYYDLVHPADTAGGGRPSGPEQPGTGNAGAATAGEARRAAITARTSELKGIRMIKVNGHGSKTRDAVGVVVTVNVDLGGLRGKPVLLSWSMWQTGSGKRIFGDWLNEHLAYELTADTDHDTTGGDFWIPLPKVKSSYFVRVWLTHNDVVLATINSPPFH